MSGLTEEGHADGRFARPDAAERLNKTLEKLKPDVVFACYGINDGIYLPFDQNRFVKYQQGMQSFNDAVVNTGAKIIYINSPLYDGRAEPKYYAEVIEKYAHWLVEQKKQKQWQVIDIFSAMQKGLEQQRKVNDGFYYSKDGIHPNREGHWVIAKTILASLGEKVMDDFETSIQHFLPNVDSARLFELVETRQSVMKDAWLTHITVLSS